MIDITIIFVSTFSSFSAHFWEGADYDLLFFFFQFKESPFWYPKKKYNYNNNNSSSDKDDNPWLDECLLICV